ncbi:PepSY-associated TM helix domain-containing protein [Streptomyces boluensis]|uniref:PepSY domain-containing protein n=1 Tax=Streptomyces boluensis TaxID=1775135 RepID=A0A964UW62_9ACTN|nr:PepSY-associated TM helix domain-containing protein [Streptomyces boluensis]NBE56539.1 PepSY domain-containing protein [Streptomyces boluensis]
MALDDRPQPDLPETAPPTALPTARSESVVAPTEDPAARRTGPWSALRPLLLRLHFYAGVLIAPFLLVAAVSGLLYSLSFQAEKLVYAHELEIPVGDTVRPLSDQVAAARAAHPEGTVTAVWPAPAENGTTRVLLSTPGLPDDRSLAVFVNPYDAEVRGELTSYGSSGALPLRTWLSELHRHLHLGEFGRNYSELAASWLWLVALGGVALWFGRRRARRRDLLVPAKGQPKGRARTLSWHGTVGLWAALGLVALSATGLTWSKHTGANIDALKAQLGGATPVVDATLAGGGSADGGHEGHGSGHGHGTAHGGADIGLDRALEIARGQGVDTQVSVILPVDGQGYVVKETDAQFPVHLDSVAVDPADGRVMDTVAFADYPLLAKLTRFGIDAHMGVFLGLPNQLALAGLMLGTVLLIVWGYRMWWLRRPTKGHAARFGRPMPRGAWRKVPPPVLVALLAGTAVIGWFVPLFGLSLLGFLVVDAVLGRAVRARAGTRAAQG